FSADNTIKYYTTTSRIALQKMIFKILIYGRAFFNTNGPGKPYSGVGSAEPFGSWEAGVWDYKALPRPGATEQLDFSLIVSWSYDLVRRMIVTYDTL
ncbi:glycoside hydrolase family 18 protein, partial [Cadophora sp. DSE1049]